MNTMLFTMALTLAMAVSASAADKPAVVKVWDGSELGSRRASMPPAPSTSLSEALSRGRPGDGSGAHGTGSGRNKPR